MAVDLIQCVRTGAEASALGDPRALAQCGVVCFSEGLFSSHRGPCIIGHGHIHLPAAPQPFACVGAPVLPLAVCYANSRGSCQQAVHSDLQLLPEGEQNPIYINGTAVEKVHSFKFLGTHISEDLSWTINTSSLVKNAHYLFLVPYRNFYRSAIRPGMPSTPCP
uniref:Uncharacterized protein n=1 Tax=Knipowitschia caucasica TaxID=637954 RepID=A0AAV2LKB9_KNICA